MKHYGLPTWPEVKFRRVIEDNRVWVTIQTLVRKEQDQKFWKTEARRVASIPVNEETPEWIEEVLSQFSGDVYKCLLFDLPLTMTNNFGHKLVEEDEDQTSERDRIKTIYKNKIFG